ncbi:MAG: O-acetyl-ADP-ribose deacetylase [Acidobacteriota bacterium]
MTKFLDGRLTVNVGDITKEKVDAIVNAANSSLIGGGGVDGAIHSAGGDEILHACRRIRAESYPDGLPTGQAVITTAGRLPANYVIHTVGPIYGENRGRDSELLADAYRNSLALAAAHGVKTIAFPAISTGVYSFPKIEAAKISFAAVTEFLDRETAITEVRFIYFSQADAEIFVSAVL